MRTRVVIDGVYQWSENVPAEPLPAKGWRGALVVGGSGPVDRQRKHARREREAVRAKKAAAA